jgi:hypothetical protein
VPGTSRFARHRPNSSTGFTCSTRGCSWCSPANLDALDAELAFRFELEYRPISQRYIVRNLNSGDQDSFATLYSALNTLGRIQRLPVIDESLLIPDRAYRVRLRALLATEQYSAPLRLLFFWRDEWQLKSEWYEWKLER